MHHSGVARSTLLFAGLLWAAIAAAAGTDQLSAELAPPVVDKAASELPLHRANPDYPRGAASAGIEGWAHLEFEITPDGSVRNAFAIESEPDGVFDSTSLSALAQWRYTSRAQPRVVQVVFRFELGEPRLDAVLVTGRSGFDHGSRDV